MKRAICILALALGGCGNDVAPPDAPPGAATFAAIKTEILDKRCSFPSCHGGVVRAAQLDLSAPDCSALVNRSSCLFPSKTLVVPGKPEASFLIDKLYGGSHLDATAPDPACADTNVQMPYGAAALPAVQIAQIEAWIFDGASCSLPAPRDAGIDAPDAPGGDANIESIAAAASSIEAGTSVDVTVVLSKPAPPGGQTIDIDVGSVSALGAPSAVRVDEGLTTFQFEVLGKRPARPTMVRATGATNSRALQIGVTGLALVELFADPVGPDDRLQWFKLENTTAVAIDLAAYTVGQGRADYTLSMTQLAGVIPPNGCFVVGGPTASAANGNPVFGQVFNFSPDLIAGSSPTGQATGTALFDAPITAVMAATVPIDAVLCGANNQAGLVGPDGSPATPSCPDVAAGHSVSRTNPGTWVDLEVPAPTSCNPL